MSAAGQGVEWRRDDDDMFAFHLDVPAGADAVDAALDHHEGEEYAQLERDPSKFDLLGEIQKPLTPKPAK